MVPSFTETARAIDWIAPSLWWSESWLKVNKRSNHDVSRADDNYTADYENCLNRLLHLPHSAGSSAGDAITGEPSTEAGLTASITCVRVFWWGELNKQRGRERERRERGMCVWKPPMHSCVVVVMWDVKGVSLKAAVQVVPLKRFTQNGVQWCVYRCLVHLWNISSTCYKAFRISLKDIQALSGSGEYFSHHQILQTCPWRCSVFANVFFWLFSSRDKFFNFTIHSD